MGEQAISVSTDEALAIMEELSHRPYRDVFQMIGILAARVHQVQDDEPEQPADERKIFVK